tara:strand:+ start:662 stop:919 length:258 start_codon:yes stop_codon:yes gene_type:complete
MADFNLAEWGIVGVVVFLFAGQIMFLQKTLMSKITEVENICIKLIDRWNRSDELRDRRHEDMVKELNDVSDDLNYLKGRINGKNQ